MAIGRASRLRSAAAAPWLAAGLIALGVAIHLPSLAQPIVEIHPFRQSYNAWTAQIYYEQGIDLLHPLVPVLGAPWEIPFDFPLQQVFGTVLMGFGLGSDAAMRLAALITFGATGLLVFILLRRLRGNAAALIGLAAFMFSPFALLESSTATIEYLAAGAGLAYAFLALLWHDTGRMRWLVAAILLGSVAMLVKGATAAMYFVPVLAVAALAARAIDRQTPGVSGRLVAQIAALVLIPGLIGIAWTMHADAVKAASPLTAGLTQSALFHWHFGYLEQRTNFGTWWPFVFRSNFMLFGGVAWLVVPAALVALARAARPQRIFLLALFLGGVAGPVVFLNLYLVHTYYVAGLSPIVAIAIGVVGGWLWMHRRLLLARVAGAGLFAAWLVTLVATRDVWLDGFQQVWDPTMALPAAADIAANSAPDEIVVVTGRDWDPAAMYYADRWGLMFRGDADGSLERALEPGMRQELLELGYRRVFHCPLFEPAGCTQIVDLASGSATSP